MSREPGDDFLRRIRDTLDTSLARVPLSTEAKIAEIRQRALREVKPAPTNKGESGLR